MRARARRDAEYFNPRSPRGERLDESALNGFFARISIHAPREGSDACMGIYPSV